VLQARQRLRYLITFMFGVVIGWVVSHVPRALGADRYATLEIFAKVLYQIDQYYIEPVDIKELIYGAVQGMVERLDPHSLFMPPDDYREVKEDTTGRFIGLGIEVAKKDGQLIVVSPIEGSPAQRAGVKPLDQIVAIDGEPTLSMTLAEAVKRLRGPRGSRIELTFRRHGNPDPVPITLIRDHIHKRAVSGRMLNKTVGLIRIRSFQEKTASETFSAISSLRAKGATGYVLDLRDNPGGLLDEAVAVSDLFIDDGVIVSIVSRTEPKVEVKRALPNSPFTISPLVVLVNEGSASAAEIVAGALKDLHRAVIVGARTFGKGTVQNMIELDDGSGLKLTIAKYLTPNGTNIHHVGIEPTVVVSESEPDGPNGQPTKATEDPFLDEAIRRLANWDQFKHAANQAG